MNKLEKLEYLALLEEKNRRNDVYRYKDFGLKLYPFQRELIRASKQYSQVMLMAANRVGKTMTGTYVDTIHALGHYPEWWDGHVFNKAPLMWLLGYSGEKCRDLLQTPIFGRRIENNWIGGLIPPEYILEHESMTGTPNAMRTVYVRHGGGGDVQYQSSKVQLWSYSELIIYHLGKNPEKAKELAGIKDPIQFAFAAANIDAQIKVQTRKPQTNPERKPSGSAPLSGAVDAREIELEKKANQTGDRTELIKHRKSKGK